MKVSLDGGTTWQEVDTVRVIQEFDTMLDNDGEDIEAELHFNFTEEGLVTDAWVNNVCQGTSSEMYTELGDRTINN